MKWQKKRTSFKHIFLNNTVVVIQSLSCALVFVTPWTEARQASLSFTISCSFLKLTSIESLMPSNLVLCCPLLLLPSIFPSVRVFSMSQLFVSGGQSIGVSASVSVLPMNIQDWFPLGLAGLISLQPKELSSLLQHISKASILLRSAFFMVQLTTCILSHSFIHSKPIALTTWNVISYHFLLLSPPTLPEKITSQIHPIILPFSVPSTISIFSLHHSLQFTNFP